MIFGGGVPLRSRCLGAGLGAGRLPGAEEAGAEALLVVMGETLTFEVALMRGFDEKPGDNLFEFVWKGACNLASRSGSLVSRRLFHKSLAWLTCQKTRLTPRPDRSQCQISSLKGGE